MPIPTQAQIPIPVLATLLRLKQTINQTEAIPLLLLLLSYYLLLVLAQLVQSLRKREMLIKIKKEVKQMSTPDSLTKRLHDKLFIVKVYLR